MKLLAAGQLSIGIFSAEGGQFVSGHAMRDEARLHTAATLSDLWDGSTIKRIRAGDAPLTLTGRRVSLHLMMQPDVSARLLSDRGLLDQGFLSRVLPSAPESTIGTRLFRVPSAASIEQVQRFSGQLAELLRRPATIASGTRNQLEPRASDTRSDRSRYLDQVRRLDRAATSTRQRIV